MIKKLFSPVTVWVILGIIASLVIGVPTCNTISNMVKVVNGAKPGSFIMSSFDDSQFMLSWPVRGGYQFVFLNRAGAPLMNAPLTQNTTGVRTAVDLVNGAVRAHWREITADQLPPQVKIALASYVTAFGNFAWNTFPTLLAIPVGSLDVDSVIPNAKEIIN